MGISCRFSSNLILDYNLPDQASQTDKQRDGTLFFHPELSTGKMALYYCSFREVFIHDGLNTQSCEQIRTRKVDPYCDYSRYSDSGSDGTRERTTTAVSRAFGRRNRQALARAAAGVQPGAILVLEWAARSRNHAAAGKYDGG
jgi:hypothetical protein